MGVGLALAGPALTPGTAAAQTTVVVDVFDNEFGVGGVPNNDPTITVGDTIRWRWTGVFVHTSTSAAGQAVTWNSGDLNTPSTFDHTFTQVGSFNYYCFHHGGDLGGGQVTGMSGTITVQPIPEPSTGLLVAALASGLAYGFRRWRRG